jgi:hypothetical protein
MHVYNNIYMVQICWIWQKVRSHDDRGFQKFLDKVEYSEKSILRYERVYGQGFISTGGLGMPSYFPFSTSIWYKFNISLPSGMPDFDAHHSRIEHEVECSSK